MSVEDACQPYMRQAEQEMAWADELACRVGDLLVDTAAKVARNDGRSRSLLLALDELSTASRQLWEGVHHLVDRRAEELWLETQRRVAS